jgi:16S rRNA (guanine(966)-N(2))-methyltransferase RsmD
MAPPRIIAGKFRGLRLHPVPGLVTRPITDRVKEALFNIIGSDINGASFLDIFGGTGSVGMEAISRGADYVVFIEKNNSAYQILQKNVSMTKDPDKYKQYHGDAFTIIEKGLNHSFDYAFVAPPQYKGMWKKMLLLLDANTPLLTKNAWVIVQIDPNEYEKITLSKLQEFDQRDYGSTRLVFYINP